MQPQDLLLVFFDVVVAPGVPFVLLKAVGFFVREDSKRCEEVVSLDVGFETLGGDSGKIVSVDLDLNCVFFVVEAAVVDF